MLCTRTRKSLAIGLLAMWLATPFAGCSTFIDEAHDRIAYSMSCPQAQVTLEEIAERTYLARGCGYKGVYVCEHKRHVRAGGARYVACDLQRGATAP